MNYALRGWPASVRLDAAGKGAMFGKWIDGTSSGVDGGRVLPDRVRGVLGEDAVLFDPSKKSVGGLNPGDFPSIGNSKPSNSR